MPKQICADSSQLRMSYAFTLYRLSISTGFILKHFVKNYCTTQNRMSKIPLRVSPVVTADWLAEKLESNPSNFAVLDCSWHMPIAKRNARREFTQSHIPGSQFLDIDDCCDKDAEYEHMLPNADVFEQHIGKLGVGNHHHVVVYDNNANFGLFSSPRVWWMFRMFGHFSVSVLDGGLPKWIEKGYATTDEGVVLPPQTFKASANISLVKSYDEMLENLTKKGFMVVDARSAGRFEGTAPEPRPGIKPGHIPDSKNVPFNAMVNKDTKQLKSPEELKEIFSKEGIDIEQPLVVTCGSGVSSCVLALGMHVCGREETPVYDGSWTEWFKQAKRGHIISSAAP